MREFIEAFLLGIVQGLTEFLPVSSSGHLLLGQYFLGVSQERFGLAFDVALHMGTLTAVVAFFWNDLWRMVYAFMRSLTRRRNLTTDNDQRLAYLVIASVFPAAVIGLLFEDIISTILRNPWIVVVNLVLVGILFIVAERMGRKTERMTKLTFPQALGIGFAQAAALVPGVSRSGATITLGLFLGLRREEAARFSFLMSVPIIAGAGAMQLLEVISTGMDAAQVRIFVIGFVSSGIVGYLAIRFFIGFVANHSLRAFAYYRFALAAVVTVLLLTFF
ncbi:undecaprenyl-diphosphatase UppP [Rubrobacter indicoceani]|uniref:undecaprenyl-diphosphatase UppP n=1 Tax=Rubrobacter indicoceani TaxID=2051957 RepID=UPI000E5B1454|nr:undecaprenyl-diphosphatase UppP [Rubrobacter indicoceani]